MERSKHSCFDYDFVESFKRLYAKGIESLMTSENLLFEIDNELQFSLKIRRYQEEVVQISRSLQSFSHSKRGGSQLSEESAREPLGSGAGTENLAKSDEFNASGYVE